MKSADYQRRLDSVLAAKAERTRAERAPIRQRNLQIAGAVLGAVAFFFVLKAAALATSDHPFTEISSEEQSFGAQIYYWFAGADPISLALATVMRASLPAVQQSL